MANPEHVEIVKRGRYRTIAIGDIHGCSIALAALVAAVDLKPDDRLVTLGDYVNKGIDSKGVLDFLPELESRCHLIPLLGNHDAVMLAAVEGRLTLEAWKTIGGMAVLQSYGDTDRIDQIPREHIAFLQRCKMWHETQTHIFAHAAYYPNRPLEDHDDATLIWQGIRDDIPGPHYSGKIAVVGHTSQKDGEILNVGHLVCIDTNCWDGGWLTAMDVESGRVWQVDERGQLR